MTKPSPALLLLSWITLLVCTLTPKATAQVSENYQTYHQLVNEAEAHITRQEFSEALGMYRHVFDRYAFVFRRDYQVATQLAWQLGQTDQAFSLLRKGIASGWTKKSIRKTQFLKPLRQHEYWRKVNEQYDSLRSIYQSGIDADTRAMVQTLFRQDQWKALGALFRFGEKARNRYILRKFAPQNERHMAQLAQIIRAKGYPGERLIGNGFWTSTLFSHHNSISVAYTQHDTLYPQLKPALRQAVRVGQMSPFEFALIDNWAISVGGDHADKSYGYLSSITPAQLVRADTLRHAIGLRSVNVRNKLIDVQEQTGMNFFLPGRPQLDGKVVVSDSQETKQP